MKLVKSEALRPATALPVTLGGRGSTGYYGLSVPVPAIVNFLPINMIRGQVLAYQHDSWASRSGAALGLALYAAVGKVVSSCQVSHLRRISCR